MSRERMPTHNGKIEIVRGSDHVVGNFVQVFDERYAGHEDDETGEGLVFDCDELFGMSVNLIGATMNDVNDDIRLEQLTELFAAKNYLNNS